MVVLGDSLSAVLVLLAPTRSRQSYKKH